MKKLTNESYLLSLGKLALMIKLMVNEQEKYAASGILDMDQMEQAATIKWQCQKMMVSINDQVSTVLEKTPRTWPEVIEQLNNELKKEVENGK